MKKYMKHKKYPPHAQVGPDIEGLINKIQEQLVSLENKIDMLIGKSSPKPVEARSFSGPFQQHSRTHGHSGGRQDNNYRERILHKAVCADCRKECEVPFKPSGDRPVYCKECFSKRKAGNGNSPEKRFDNKSRETGPAQAANSYKPQGGEKKRFSEKKRPAAKRRRK